MSRPDAGLLVPIADVKPNFIGIKIRTVGFLAKYEARTGHGQITSGEGQLAVDFNLASASLPFGSLQLQSKLMVIGAVEKLEPSQVLCLVAICVIPVEDLDFRVWEQAARQLSLELHNRSK